MLNARLLIIPTGQQLFHGMPHLPLIPTSQTLLLPHRVLGNFSTQVLLVVLFQLPRSDLLAVNHVPYAGQLDALKALALEGLEGLFLELLEVFLLVLGGLVGLVVEVLDFGFFLRGLLDFPQVVLFIL